MEAVKLAECRSGGRSWSPGSAAPRTVEQLPALIAGTALELTAAKRAGVGDVSADINAA